jgi:threonyl-tRNA synthetase
MEAKPEPPAAAAPKEPKAAPAPKEKQPKAEKPKTQGDKPKADKPKDGAAAPEKKKGPIELKEQNPEYVAHRAKLFEEIKKEQAAQLAAKAAASGKVKVTLPDGKQLDAEAWKTTPLDIARGISKKLAENALVAVVDEQKWDLGRPLEKDCKLSIVTFDSPEGKKVFWHSSAHLLGQALERLYAGSLCIGPPLADGGFYYDLALGDRAVTSEDYDTINAMVEKIVKEKQGFERVVLTKAQALEMFKHNKYKVQLISQKVPDGDTCTAYRCGPLIDLCKGPHVPDTGRIKAFSVWKNSSAYWLGKAENDSLQRVYGISFPDPKLHKEWLELQAAAAARDHRLLGTKQGLFFFHPYSPGCAFLLPHGMRIFNTLVQFLRGQYHKRGFTEVGTPNIFNKELWETSGHWQNYRENMFSFEVEKTIFALKPMNCPSHCLMFQHTAHSYKELPLRFADFGVLHRNELSGALTGLTRVRKFQQDDAHIFCREDQIESEIMGALGFLQDVYHIFGFHFDLELSTRPEKSMGETAQWELAEGALKKVLDGFGRPWKLNPGDGAFYGPKIDIHVYDALKRAYQCATIQLDFQLPIRFGLEYTGTDGQPKRPVIIHRAILGSVERLMAILVEHTAGKWPLWLSPRQAIVIPVAEPYEAYAKEVQATLHAAGFFVDVDLSDNTLTKKIREAQLAQYNFLLVVGEQEKDAKSVSIRTRDDNKVTGTQPLVEFLAHLQKLVAEYK